jgi:hypothetical protein
MDACGCTNHVRYADHAESRRDPQPEKINFGWFSWLVELNIDRGFVPFICMLPTQNCHWSRRFYFAVAMLFSLCA